MTFAHDDRPRERAAAPDPSGMLGADLSALLGRDEDVVVVSEMLRDARLVTLCGPGGVGKTRLAEAVVRGLARDDRRQTGWVWLAGVTDPGLVAAGVTTALGLPLPSLQTDIGAALVQRLRDEEHLVVLDNCEHLSAACAALAQQLLRGCPGLRILTTSREALGVPGERRYPVPALGLPLPDGPRFDAEVAATCAAVQLFVARARAVSPSFVLDRQTVDPVVRVCRLLDGLPLALELAAARIRVLPVEEVAEGLDDVFRLLVGGPRTAPVRQQTLEATLDWSHRLLSDVEQALFRRLSVFEGDATLSRIRHVGSGPGIEPDEILDLLAQLVDKSLVSLRPTRPPRYAMLRTVRMYGRHRLAESVEEREAHRRHLATYVEATEADEHRLFGPEQLHVLDLFEAAVDDLRSALSHAQEDDDPAIREAGLRLAAALSSYCALRGRYAEGREWLDRALTGAPQAPAALRAKALYGAGRLAFLHCDYAPALRRLGAALRLYRELDDPRGAAAALQALAGVAREQGRYDHARDLCVESAVLAASCGDELAAARADGYLGFVAWLQGDFAKAGSHCQRALEQFRALADNEGIAWSLLSLGVVALRSDDHDRAVAWLEESLKLSQQIDYREGIAWAQHQRGVLALRSGQVAAAGHLLLNALDLHRQLGDLWRAASVVEDLAALAQVRGEARLGARLLGAAGELRSRLATPLAPVEQLDHDKTVGRLRTSLGQDRVDEETKQGRSGPLDDLVGRVAALLPAAVPTEGSSRPPVTAVAPRLHLQMLGSPDVRVGTRVVEASDFTYAKPRELLFLLASSPPLTKAQIGDALWPEVGPAELRNSLHTALRHLRAALGDRHWIVFSSSRYAVDRSDDPWVDVDVFTAELTAARGAPADQALAHLYRAVDVYAGDFLLPSTAGDWAAARREELRRAYHWALGAAAQLLTRADRHQEAADMYRKVIASEPLLEGAHRQLMRALAREGERVLALRHYERLTELLTSDLGVAPASETTALYRQIAAQQGRRR